MYYNITFGGSRCVQDKLRIMAAATRGVESERVGRRERETTKTTMAVEADYVTAMNQCWSVPGPEDSGASEAGRGARGSVCWGRGW